MAKVEMAQLIRNETAYTEGTQGVSSKMQLVPRLPELQVALPQLVQLRLQSASRRRLCLARGKRRNEDGVSPSGTFCTSNFAKVKFPPPINIAGDVLRICFEVAGGPAAVLRHSGH